MDRNTLIGFGLIGLLLIGMFYINSKGRLAMEAEQKRKADSIAALQPKVDSKAAFIDSLKRDSLARIASIGDFNTGNQTESLVNLENDRLKIQFSTKGGQPRVVELKGYKKLDGTPVILQQGNVSKFSYPINSGTNKMAASEQLNFQALPVITNADKSTTLMLEAADSAGRKIQHVFTLHPGNFMMDVKINLIGAESLISQKELPLQWQYEAQQVEKNHAYELTQTHICYLEDGNYDFAYVGSGDDKEFKKPVDWISIKQQFFIAALVGETTFKDVKASWTVPKDSANYLLHTNTEVKIPLNTTAGTASVPFKLYYGPSDYNVLKQYHNQMENIVPYGSGIFAFVKYINRHFLLPVFDFLQRHVSSMGIVILLITLLIRLITSPILYKSYLSGAKMKALKPEVDALKEKYKDDQQAFGMEQMKLWRSAGVSPLGGCLPALLQIPIFMSLYYFFQSNISLRGQSFLWAKDLSAFDSIAHLPFKIPFYGDHVSLFTLTAVITSLLISLYSMSNMQDNSNPLMKYMPYIFPVLLLGVFNNLPSALTWYYTVSNFITLVLQFVIQKYIINHDKILAEINENRKKPVKKSKLQERIDAMQETQKRMQEMKNKGNQR